MVIQIWEPAPTLSPKLTSRRGKFRMVWHTFQNTTEIQITLTTFLSDPHTYLAWLKGERVEPSWSPLSDQCVTQRPQHWLACQPASRDRESGWLPIHDTHTL